MRGAMSGRAWVVMAIAGLGVAPASGQSVTTDLVVALTFDRTSIGIGETAVATVRASWVGVTGTYMSYVGVDLIASGAFVEVGQVAPIAWNNPMLGFDGQGLGDGADVRGMQAAQFSLIPPYVTGNPILITTFRVTGVAEGLLSYHSETIAGTPFPYDVTGGWANDPPVWGNDVFVSQTLVVTPGPGVAVVLCVAGMIGCGRRTR
ncbi:MAG: hypothetical protein LAT64_01175 [Phycisphaerales bacterium]|nr:hypothetical protein [Planctomycetota bacterium]MCH8507374.1 hypothetical protein [Phycisphaerales bacterium]